jgi:hypothetical protein
MNLRRLGRTSTTNKNRKSQRLEFAGLAALRGWPLCFFENPNTRIKPAAAAKTTDQSNILQKFQEPCSRKTVVPFCAEPKQG